MNRTLWHLTEEKGWHQVTLEAGEARRALEVDPKHWSAEDPRAAAVADTKAGPRMGRKHRSQGDED